MLIKPDRPDTFRMSFLPDKLGVWPIYKPSVAPSPGRPCPPSGYSHPDQGLPANP